MTPAPQDTAICKATGRDHCLGKANIVRECIPASVVESRAGARGWYCAAHGREAIARRAAQLAFSASSGRRCCMCGETMRESAIVTLTIGPGDPHPVDLEFCSERCRARWEKRS